MSQVKQFGAMCEWMMISVYVNTYDRQDLYNIYGLDFLEYLCYTIY